MKYHKLVKELHKSVDYNPNEVPYIQFVWRLFKESACSHDLFIKMAKYKHLTYHNFDVNSLINGNNFAADKLDLEMYYFETLYPLIKDGLIYYTYLYLEQHDLSDKCKSLLQCRVKKTTPFNTKIHDIGVENLSIQDIIQFHYDMHALYPFQFIMCLGNWGYSSEGFKFWSNTSFNLERFLLQEIGVVKLLKKIGVKI